MVGFCNRSRFFKKLYYFLGNLSRSQEKNPMPRKGVGIFLLYVNGYYKLIIVETQCLASLLLA
jgi:hypothetical protein